MFCLGREPTFVEIRVLQCCTGCVRLQMVYWSFAARRAACKVDFVGRGAVGCIELVRVQTVSFSTAQSLMRWGVCSAGCWP